MNCGAKAVLIITRAVTGTTTNVVRRRAELHCDEAEGHAGPHVDSRNAEEWEAEPGKVATVLRHEPGD